MDVILRQVQAFEAVVRVKGLSRAAEVTHIAQPTVSKLMRRRSRGQGEAGVTLPGWARR
jgi:DNA-binding transcriptional LysR family regulator